MNRKALIAEIRRRARQDEKHRHDRRFLDTLGFLVAKGLLKTNMRIDLLPNKRLRIEDAVWAGQNVEPRILEVLPAAVLRLGRHFDLDPAKHPELVRTIERLRSREAQGDAFLGVPYEKLKVWAELPLRDRRVKPVTEKKVVKTFRLSLRAIERLRRMARQSGSSETSVLESLLTTGVSG